MSRPDVVIVGAGLAGLCCAKALQAAGVSFQVIEASDGVGGRVRTDIVDGFLLDRGFQVLLTAYPEALAQLDYDALNLCAFFPGASVRRRGHFYRLVDPWREPSAALPSLFSGVGSLMDKLRVARLRSDVLRGPVEALFDQPETSTLRVLQNRRFTPKFIDSFFRPFLGGIMLDNQLTVSSRMFEFVFRMLAEGDTAVPANGMGAIPEQLASRLPAGSIRLNASVAEIQGNAVLLESGERIEGSAVVVACEGPATSRLLKQQRNVASRSVTTVYLSANQPPLDDPILVLGGSGRGVVNNLAVLDRVAPTYAPAGKSLVSVTVLGNPVRDDAVLVKNVKSQLKRWFGLAVDEWRVLRIYRIEHAQPAVASIHWDHDPRVSPGLYQCGDHLTSPSIQGAMLSGRLAAEAVLADAATPR
jgi:phytoene dehydrogenase-like protein